MSVKILSSLLVNRWISSESFISYFWSIQKPSTISRPWWTLALHIYSQHIPLLHPHAWFSNCNAVVFKSFLNSHFVWDNLQTSNNWNNFDKSWPIFFCICETMVSGIRATYLNHGHFFMRAAGLLSTESLLIRHYTDISAPTSALTIISWVTASFSLPYFWGELSSARSTTSFLMILGIVRSHVLILCMLLLSDTLEAWITIFKGRKRFLDKTIFTLEAWLYWFACFRRHTNVWSAKAFFYLFRNENKGVGVALTIATCFWKFTRGTSTRRALQIK